MQLSRIKLYWRVFWHMRKMHLMRTFEFRGNFYFWGLVSVLWTLFNIFFFAMISGIGHGIGGWTPAELYVLLSIFTMLDALIWSFFFHNMSRYTQAVFSGELGTWLLRPLDSQFLIMTSNNNYTNIFRFLLGLGLLGWSLPATGVQVSLVNVVLFTITICSSMLLLYSIWFMMSTISFYVERLNNINDIIPSLRQVWQVPRTVYTGLASTVITVLLPLGLATSIPTELLLGKNVGWWGLYLVLFSLLSFWLSRRFFFYSLHRYSGAGG